MYPMNFQNINLISQYGWDILLIIILLFFGKGILSFLVSRMKRLARNRYEEEGDDFEKRAETLGVIITTTGNIVIYGIVIIMLLDLFGVDIRPILAGAGIAGLAVGFGAQNLVKDFVSGLFILIENQYAVGDDVKIYGIEGKVLEVTVRTTVLKSKDGNRVYISNGNVSSKEVENYTQSKKGN